MLPGGTAVADDSHSARGADSATTASELQLFFIFHIRDGQHSGSWIHDEAGGASGGRLDV